MTSITTFDQLTPDCLKWVLKHLQCRAWWTVYALVSKNFARAVFASVEYRCWREQMNPITVLRAGALGMFKYAYHGPREFDPVVWNEVYCSGSAGIRVCINNTSLLDTQQLKKPKYIVDLIKYFACSFNPDDGYNYSKLELTHGEILEVMGGSARDAAWYVIFWRDIIEKNKLPRQHEHACIEAFLRSGCQSALTSAQVVLSALSAHTALSVGGCKNAHAVAQIARGLDADLLPNIKLTRAVVKNNAICALYHEQLYTYLWYNGMLLHIMQLVRAYDDERDIAHPACDQHASAYIGRIVLLPRICADMGALADTPHDNATLQSASLQLQRALGHFKWMDMHDLENLIIYYGAYEDADALDILRKIRIQRKNSLTHEAIGLRYLTRDQFARIGINLRAIHYAYVAIAPKYMPAWALDYVQTNMDFTGTLVADVRDLKTTLKPYTGAPTARAVALDLAIKARAREMLSALYEISKKYLNRVHAQ